MPSRFKLVAFDLDGTLIEDKSSWLKVHKYFNTTSKAEEYLRLYCQGKITYEEFMKKDIEAWPKPLHISKIIQILSTCKVRPEAKSVIQEIRNRGLEVAIISAGIEHLAKRVANELGIHHFFANKLCVDENGYLTGEGVMEVEPARKDKALRVLAERLGLSLSQCIAVGDSPLDSSFLKAAGLGLYLGSEKEARSIGVKSISNLSEILNYI
ncbi:MAG: HAD-IB family phosphatase [Nitrososphaerota archaeon]|nr:HAD-IB family phosphatase [Nitrososphaerota archaeon]